MDSENTTNKGFEFDPEKEKQRATGDTANQSTGYEGDGNMTKATPQNAKMQQPLPNSGGILAMGIISIVLFCCCYGIISVALGIIALILAAKANKVYKQNPEAFTISSYKNMKAGQVTAIIGLSLAGLMIIFLLIMVASGINILSTQEALKEFEQAWESTGY